MMIKPLLLHQHPTSDSPRLWGLFFQVAENGELPVGGQQVSLYLQKRDKLSMVCVNQSCYEFFARTFTEGL